MGSVFRLELDGLGPYRIGPDGRDNFRELHNRLLQSHGWDERDDHPCWGMEFGYSTAMQLQDAGYIAGCETLEQLKDWFGEFYDELIEFGFEVVEYEAGADTRHCERQLVFQPKRRVACHS